MLSETLVKLLVCADDKESLLYIESENALFNPRTRRLYRIENGIPVMLIDQSTIVSEEEAARLSALPHRVTGTGQ
ncbi:MAG: Trm112 family protein [Actinomycetota bacterium]|nr:Trm112 family protein [Actinomycetota bacterium]